MREKFRPCLISHFHTPGQSQHEVGVNVTLLVLVTDIVRNRNSVVKMENRAKEKEPVSS